MAQLELPLEELVRPGAREILHLAVEVEAFWMRFESESLRDGRRAVGRNGHLAEREILTAVGPVVDVPKVRDRSGRG